MHAQFKQPARSQQSHVRVFAADNRKCEQNIRLANKPNPNIAKREGLKKKKKINGIFR